MSSSVLAWVGVDGCLQKTVYNITGEIGSNTRAAQCDALNRHIEALEGQGIKCGRWTLEDWARGCGKAALNTKEKES